MFKLYFLPLIFLLTIVIARPEEKFKKLELTLQQKLSSGSKVNIFITFSEGTKSILEAISSARFPTRDDKLKALHSGLAVNADAVQSNVKTLLGQSGFQFKVLWITNQIFVPNADISLVSKLAKFEEISRIEEELVLKLDDPVDFTLAQKRQAGEEGEWGIKKIQAQEALALLRNVTTTATEIRISTIDTGVRVTHEALKDNFLGTYGWLDPYEYSLSPNDYNGHGSHVTGTICGKKGIGVYPEAKWLACKGCATTSCSQLALLVCGQFLTCPTLPDGTNPDCSKAPHLVSNSWGGGQGQEWFDKVIAAWHVADIIPLFSIGNLGNLGCGSAISPGDREGVIGVGATTITDELSSFSSVGPALNGGMKPEVSAPGSEVISAYHTGDDVYVSMSGTSMACPHAAGLTALLLAYDETLGYEEVKALIFSGAQRALTSGGKECAGLGDNVFPNHHFGQGRINAFRSLFDLIETNRV